MAGVSCGHRFNPRLSRSLPGWLILPIQVAICMSDDEPFYTPNLKRAPLGVGQPGEPLYDFTVGERRFRFELRDYGEHGVECQIFRDDDFGRAVTSTRGSTERGSRGTWRFSGRGKCESSSRRIRTRRSARERAIAGSCVRDVQRRGLDSRCCGRNGDSLSVVQRWRSTAVAARFRQLPQSAGISNGVHRELPSVQRAAYAPTHGGRRH